MLDPVIVCSPPAADLFWGFSGAAWTAIASIVSATSVIALVVFNWKYLRIAREQTLAAITQAKVAQATLNSLQTELSNKEELDRHSAVLILQHALANLSLWQARVRTPAVVSDSNPIQLLPDTWNLLLIFIAKRHRGISERIRNATQEIRGAQIDLNEILKVEFRDRSSSSVSIRIDQVISKLESVMVKLGEIEKIIALVPPTLYFA